MDVELYKKHYHLEARHWWFCARRRIVQAVLRRYVAPNGCDGASRVCDIGCGTGILLQDLIGAGYQATGVDPSPDALNFCRHRGVPVVEGALPDALPAGLKNLDAVLLLDVLEHIPDDAAALRQALSLLRPGGVAICTVPAYPWMWTQRDTNQHHLRRYWYTQYARLIARQPGAKALFQSYLNCTLLPLAALVRGADRLWPGEHRGFRDLKVPRWGFNRLFDKIFGSEKALLGRGMSLPFGLSMIAVIRRD